MEKCNYCSNGVQAEGTFCQNCPLRQLEIKQKKSIKPCLILPVVLVILVSLIWFPTKEKIPLEEEAHYVPPYFQLWEEGLGTESGENFYTCPEGSFHIVAVFHPREKDTYCIAPEPRLELELDIGESIIVDCFLYVLTADDSAFAKEEFGELVNEVRFLSYPIDGGGFLQPALAMAYPDDPMVFARCVFNLANSYTPSLRYPLRWEIEMKNGDIIHVEQLLDADCEIIRTVYSYKDYPMDTIEQLQAIINSEQNILSYCTDIYLPPTVYEGELALHSKRINLYGTTGENGELLTVFTDTVHAYQNYNGGFSFENIAFSAKDGVGLDAKANVELNNCVFDDCSVGLRLSFGGWAESTNCLYSNNEVGILVQNIDYLYRPATEFTANSFTNNDVAFHLERVYDPLDLSFPNCVFSGNKENTINSTESTLDLSGAKID